MPRAVLVAPVAVLAVCGAMLAGCGGHHRSATASPPVVVSTSSSPTPTVTPAPGLRSPLTGLPIGALRPVIGVKIDNVGTYGMTGLDAADIVYCEEVEGGLTRLLALYAATPPPTAGPVRSGRQSDLQLLGQYGRIAMAFSGANSLVSAQFRAANLVDDSYDDQTSFYTFDYARPRPYQFLAEVARLVAAHPGVLEHDVGFRFGTPTTPGTAATRFAVHYPHVLMSGTSTAAGYVVARDSVGLVSDARPVTTTDVLLQYVSVHATGLVDHNGNPTPYSQTIGSGRAVLLRGGHAYVGTWSRTSQNGPTTWRSATGGSLLLAPGRTWVFLVPLGSVVSIG